MCRLRVVGYRVDRYVGTAGTKIGMRTFGASAPIEDLQTKFGFTQENVLAAAKEQIAKHRKFDGMKSGEATPRIRSVAMA